jgi:hypothetical protein
MIRQKPAEVIEAQIAAYGASEIAHRPDRAYLLERAAGIAVTASAPSHLMRVLKDDEFVIQDGENLPAGTRRTVGSFDSYVTFLRQAGGSNAPEIANRARLLSNFNNFREAASGYQQEELGRGNRAVVSRIVVDDHSYALRRKLTSGGEADIDSHMAAAAGAHLSPRSEHIIAGTYEEGGATIAEIIPGKKLSQVSPEEAGSVTKQQLGDLVHTIVFLSEQHIHVDTGSPDNYYYDPEYGFSVLDLSSLTADAPHELPISTALVSLVGTMTDPPAEIITAPHSDNDFSAERTYMEARTPWLETYREICTELPIGILKEQDITDLDRAIERTYLKLAYYSDPQSEAGIRHSSQFIQIPADII